MKFKTHRDCYNWIISNQLSKRNVTSETRDYLIGKRYESEKKPVGNPNQLEHNVPIATAEKIAEEYKVTHMTIKRAEKFSIAVDSIISIFPAKQQNEMKLLLLNRGLKLSKKDILDLSTFPPKLIKEVIEEKKEYWQARSEANKNIKAARLRKATKLSLPKDIKLYVGDALKLANKHIKDESIDCIVSDPPYSKDALKCFNKLGEISERVLKPSGFCCFYSGKLYLDEVFRIMSKHLNYYWQIILLHHGKIGTGFNPDTVQARKVDTFYKSILIFQKPPIKRTSEYFDDVIKGSGIEKSLHPWQQSEKELHQVVDKFSEIGSTILDPFNGAGTTGVVAKKLGRKYIGFDIDADCIKESKIRIRNLVNVESEIKSKKRKVIKSNIKFYLGDCRTIIPKHKILDKADIAIFDPPYNQNFKYDKYKDNLPKKEYIKMLSMFKDFPCAIVHYPEQSMSMVYEAMRKEPSKVISWNYNSNLSKNYRLISCFNCTPDFTKSPQPYDAPYDRRVQKSILDGRLKPLRDWWDDIGIVNNVSREKTEHPCQVPVALCERLLSILTEEGMTILDPYSGSGSMSVACKRNGRHFIGIELSKSYIDIAKKRIRKC
jgi:DNA modification methylase